jgi:hypothetical protein
MGIAGKVVDGVMIVKHNGVEYPLIKSNARAVESYLHTGDEAYLLALATEEELQRYGN